MFDAGFCSRLTLGERRASIGALTEAQRIVDEIRSPNLIASSGTVASEESDAEAQLPTAASRAHDTADADRVPNEGRGVVSIDCPGHVASLFRALGDGPEEGEEGVRDTAEQEDGEGVVWTVFDPTACRPRRRRRRRWKTVSKVLWQLFSTAQCKRTTRSHWASARQHIAVLSASTHGIARQRASAVNGEARPRTAGGHDAARARRTMGAPASAKERTDRLRGDLNYVE